MLNYKKIKFCINSLDKTLRRIVKKNQSDDQNSLCFVELQVENILYYGLPVAVVEEESIVIYKPEGESNEESSLSVTSGKVKVLSLSGLEQAEPAALVFYYKILESFQANDA